MLCLADHPNLQTWRARNSYLKAADERESYAFYGMDLLWLLVKRQYQDADLEQPSAIRYGTKDTRTAEQIKQDLLARL